MGVDVNSHMGACDFLTVESSLEKLVAGHPVTV